jgi:hypothetical protein
MDHLICMNVLTQAIIARGAMHTLHQRKGIHRNFAALIDLNDSTIVIMRSNATWQSSWHGELKSFGFAQDDGNKITAPALL